MGEVIFIWVIVGLVCGFIGWIIADGKGRGGAGFGLGFLLGPIGLIIAALLSPSADQVVRERLYIEQQMAAGRSAPAGWHPDPRGRYEYRYWDGVTWTSEVSTAGVRSSDPLGA